LSPQLRARFASANQRLDQMAQAAGLEMVHPDLIPNSRRALEATEYARAQGKHREFHHIVFRKYYGEGQDINRWDVLRAAAQEVGLDAEEMEREVERGQYHQALDDQIAEASAIGVNAVPTYVLDDKYGVVGAQPYEVFQRVLARLSAEREAEV
ncbi:MAG: DsbA family protein, partial [Anaerolineae bacterium]